MRYLFADYVLDTEGHVLLCNNEPVDIEPQVFDLLHLLVRNPGRLMSRDNIVADVWMGRIVSESTISARIASARKAIGDNGRSQKLIQTVARRGLKWVAEVSTEERVSSEPSVAGQRIRYAQTPEGQSLAYTVTGSGPNVLRGGYNSTDLEAEWNTPSERQLFETLGARFSLLRFDPIGFGRSDRSLKRFSFDSSAENMILAADSAGFERFALYCESGGVLAAIRVAVRYPERVTRLAIVGGYAEGRGRREPNVESDALRSMAAEGWHAPEISFVSAMMLSYFPEGPLDAVHNMARNLLSACSQDVMLQLRDAIHQESVLTLLPQVQCPTLVIHSRHDNVHPVSEAQKLAAGIPNAELLVLESANHIPLPGNAVWAEFVDALIGFLGE